VTRGRQRATTWQWAGLGAGLVAGAIATASGGLGRGVLLAAPLFGLLVLLGVLAGQLAGPARTGPVRAAQLKVRRVRDYLPRALAAAVAAGTVLLSALLAFTTAMGSADDAGRAGRQLVRRCTATQSEGHSPWAGSFYSLPLAVLLLAGLGAGLLTLNRVVRRGRPGDPLAPVIAADDAERRNAARAVIGAAGILVTIPLITLSLSAAGGLLAISCRPTWWTLLAWSLLIMAPPGFALLIASSLAVLPRHLRSAIVARP
jgi:hypothetical protein